MGALKARPAADYAKDLRLSNILVNRLKTATMTRRTRRRLQIGTAILSGFIALTAYAGVIGLVGGGISFGEVIDSRLPFHSLFLAGIALLFVVAAPMTLAAVACIRDLRYTSELVMGAGLLLIGWIAIELAFIESYSWLQPACIALGIVAVVCGWLLERADRPASQTAADRHAEPQLRS